MGFNGDNRSLCNFRSLGQFRSGIQHKFYYKGKTSSLHYGFNFTTLSETTAFANALYVLKHGAGAAELAVEAEFADKARKYPRCL